MTYAATRNHAPACQDDISIGRTQSSAAKLIYHIGQWVRRMSRRWHLVTLGQMSDQQLSDIGLYRDDIFEAAALGYDRDVTCHLAEIVRRRRNISVPAGRAPLINSVDDPLTNAQTIPALIPFRNDRYLPGLHYEKSDQGRVFWFPGSIVLKSHECDYLVKPVFQVQSKIHVINYIPCTRKACPRAKPGGGKPVCG